MKRTVLTASGLAGVLAMASAPVLADAEGTEGNSFTITPYLWGTNVDGTVSPSRIAPDVDIDASFSDISDQLDRGYALAGDARWGRFGLLADYSFAELSDGESIPGASVDYNLEFSIASLGAYYRVDNNPEMDVDIYAGGRWWDAETRLDVTAGPASARRKNDQSWTDYVVGARVHYQPGDRWYFKGLGDYGAGDSDSTWQLYGAGGYVFNQTVSAELGYRILDVDYEEDGFLYDATHEGILAGLNFKF